MQYLSLFVAGLLCGLAVMYVAIDNTEQPLQSEATIACPFGSTMTFLRGADATLKVSCTYGD